MALRFVKSENALKFITIIIDFTAKRSISPQRVLSKNTKKNFALFEAL